MLHGVPPNNIYMLKELQYESPSSCYLAYSPLPDPIVNIGHFPLSYKRQETAITWINKGN